MLKPITIILVASVSAMPILDYDSPDIVIKGKVLKPQENGLKSKYNTTIDTIPVNTPNASVPQDRFVLETIASAVIGYAVEKIGDSLFDDNSDKTKITKGSHGGVDDGFSCVKAPQGYNNKFILTSQDESGTTFCARNDQGCLSFDTASSCSIPSEWYKGICSETAMTNPEHWCYVSKYGTPSATTAHGRVCLRAPQGYANQYIAVGDQAGTTFCERGSLGCYTYRSLNLCLNRFLPLNWGKGVCDSAAMDNPEHWCYIAKYGA